MPTHGRLAAYWFSACVTHAQMWSTQGLGASASTGSACLGLRYRWSMLSARTSLASAGRGPFVCAVPGLGYACRLPARNGGRVFRVSAA
jgi:hypothetical protein